LEDSKGLPWVGGLVFGATCGRFQHSSFRTSAREQCRLTRSINHFEIDSFNWYCSWWHSLLKDDFFVTERVDVKAGDVGNLGREILLGPGFFRHSTTTWAPVHAIAIQTRNASREGPPTREIRQFGLANR
jgi:hypothetical protein